MVLSTALVRATLACMKCPILHAVKVIRRCAREHTIEKKYTYIYTNIIINIYRGFILNTTYRCLLAH